MKVQFKINNSYEQRTKQSFKLIERYEQMKPIIVELSIDNIKAQKKGIPNKLQRSQKMMIYGETKMVDLFNIFKKQYSPYISQFEGLYMFCGGNKLLNFSSDTLADTYQKYKDDDGWLYLLLRIQDQTG